MKNARTLTALRNELQGRVYIYLDSAQLCRQFLQSAEDEGFRFGEILPTKTDGSDLIALESGKQLSYVGFAGHMALQCGGGSDGKEFHRIAYRRFLSGDEAFL